MASYPPQGSGRYAPPPPTHTIPTLTAFWITNTWRLASIYDSSATLARDMHAGHLASLISPHLRRCLNVRHGQYHCCTRSLRSRTAVILSMPDIETSP